MKELSVTGFLREVLEQHRTRPDHPFCWILGAGASVSSDIPTAGKLAQEFLACLCEDATGSKDQCDAWIKTGALKIDGLDPLDPAKHYPELYERRYGDCPDAGYAFLEDVMRDKRPSYGYAVLALILEKTPHRIVITTNFDNLVADALAAHSTTFPRVVGHAQLTQFVQTEVRRPLVAKIHGDLGFRMSNTPDEIAALDKPWQEALERIFRRFTPIVIGYGGNDRTLMKLLRDLPRNIPDRIYWCQWEQEQPALHVSEFLAAKEGARLIRHAGFDALMLQLEVELRKSSGLDLPSDLVKHLKQRQAARLASFREQREALGKALASAERPARPEQAESPVEAQERQALAGAAAQALAGGSAPREKAKTWWAWVLEARAAPTIDARDEVYRAAVNELPREARLLGGYATFLWQERHDLDRAEELYKRAIDADPKHVNNLGNYAVFLRNERRNLDRAEELYKRAIDADPKHVNNLGNYANFLRSERRDLDRAEELYKRAIDAGPSSANTLGSYAVFLCDERRDLDRAEELYKRAIDADPKNANALGNYAQLLLANGRGAEGAKRLVGAFAGSGLTDSLLSELWFYAYAHATDRWPDALGRLKGLLQAGARSKGWDLSANVSRAQADGHPESALVAGLADVITGTAEIATLDQFATWRDAKAIPLDSAR